MQALIVSCVVWGVLCAVRRGVRDVPHLQVAGDRARQGDAALLPPVREVRLAMLRRLHQAGLPGAGRSARTGQSQDRLTLHSHLLHSHTLMHACLSTRTHPHTPSTQAG